jgi:hypothetical protein
MLCYTLTAPSHSNCVHHDFNVSLDISSNVEIVYYKI